MIFIMGGIDIVAGILLICLSDFAGESSGLIITVGILVGIKGLYSILLSF